MKSNLLSWNVRGPSKWRREASLELFLRIQLVDLVCLQETKFKKTWEEAGLFRRVGLLGWWVY